VRHSQLAAHVWHAVRLRVRDETLFHRQLRGSGVPHDAEGGVPPRGECVPVDRAGALALARLKRGGVGNVQQLSRSCLAAVLAWPRLRELTFLLAHLHRPRGICVHLRLRHAADLVAAASARGIHCTPNSRVSSHSTAVAATACRAPRTARTLIVSSARHLPSLKVRVIRAIWL